MKFTFETNYDQKAFTAMARTLRKTVRKKRSRRSHIFGWIAVALGLMLTLLPGDEGFSISAKTVVTWVAIALILLFMLFEDIVNGYIGRKRTLPGLNTSTTTFTAEGYSSVTAIGTSQFAYDNIITIAETRDYFVLIFSANHAQIYDKNSITGGTAEDFVKFIEEVTHLEVLKIQA